MSAPVCVGQCIRGTPPIIRTRPLSAPRHALAGGHICKRISNRRLVSAAGVSSVARRDEVLAAQEELEQLCTCPIDRGLSASVRHLTTARCTHCWSMIFTSFRVYLCSCHLRTASSIVISSVQVHASNEGARLGAAPCSSSLHFRYSLLTCELLPMQPEMSTRIEDLCQRLEGLGGPVELSWVAAGHVNCSMDLLAGVWRLLYSSAFLSGSLGGLRPGPPVNLSPVKLVCPALCTSVSMASC
jgi:hypothetical protein